MINPPVSKRAQELIDAHPLAGGHFQPGTLARLWVEDLMEQYGREIREAAAEKAAQEGVYPGTVKIIREMDLP